MSHLRNLRHSLLFLACAVLLGIYAPQLTAQDDTRVVSLAVPDSMEVIFQDVILPPFMEANPTIQVHLTKLSSDLYQDLMPPTSPESLAKYLEASATLASTADVHLIPPFILAPENTRAGYFLDLNPLIQSDA